MSNLEFSKTSPVYSMTCGAMAAGVSTITVNNTTAPFYPQCSKIVGIKYVNGSAGGAGVPLNAVVAANLPFVSSIEMGAVATRTIIIHLSSIDTGVTYNGAIYQLFWVNECLPNAGFC